MVSTLLCGVIDKTQNLKAVDSIILALLGIALVFIVLIFLMFVIWCMGKSFDAITKYRAEHPKKPRAKKAKKGQTVVETEEAVPQELAPGSCGELVLVKTTEQEAAMIMAIVADSTSTPLNELRFKSIKRLDEAEEK